MHIIMVSTIPIHGHLEYNKDEASDVVIASVTAEILSSLKAGNKLKITSEYSDEWMIFSLSGSSAALSAIGL